MAADPRWYEKLGGPWFDEAWRDPWVFADPDAPAYTPRWPSSTTTAASCG